MDTKKRGKPQGTTCHDPINVDDDDDGDGDASGEESSIGPCLLVVVVAVNLAHRGQVNVQSS